jgi:peptide/nickel transport system permease protein
MIAFSLWCARRVASGILVVAGIAALTFVLVHLAPGDPVYLLAGDSGSLAYYQEMRAKYGLDRTLFEQFVLYGRSILWRDFGYSFMYQAPVFEVVMAHLPASLLLGATATVLATVVGSALGYLAVAHRSNRVDAIVRGWASASYAAPVFWTGQLLMILMSVKLGWLPVGGMFEARQSTTGIDAIVDVGRHLILPALTLSLPFMAVVIRVSRASLLETLREPFVDAAYARGLGRHRVMLRHAAPLAALPVVALVGQHAAQLAAGAALTESLFAWPGIGYLILHASQHRDYPLVTATFIVISTAVVVVNALTDALCAWLDPRIRRTS